MSKYTELAIKTNAVEDVKTQVEKSAPILAAKLNAIISSQSAVVMEAQADLVEADQLVDKARGYITTNAQTWLSQLNYAKTQRDMASEDLNVAEDYFDELKEEAKLFV
jgi:hypothetical protein